MASEKIVKFGEEIKTLTVLELAELVSAIEEEFGVSAAAPVAVAGAVAGGGDLHSVRLHRVQFVEAGRAKPRLDRSG